MKSLTRGLGYPFRHCSPDVGDADLEASPVIDSTIYAIKRSFSSALILLTCSITAGMTKLPVFVNSIANFPVAVLKKWAHAEMSFPLDGYAAVGMEKLEFIAVALPGQVLDLDSAREEKPRYAALLP